MWRLNLPPLVALALGVLLGSSLTWHSPGRSLAVWQAPAQPAPRPQEACPPVTLTPSGAGAAFSSFIYPTWPVSHQKPAVRRAGGALKPRGRRRRSVAGLLPPHARRPDAGWGLSLLHQPSLPHPAQRAPACRRTSRQRHPSTPRQTSR